jgi:hypothetical protein
MTDIVSIDPRTAEVVGARGFLLADQLLPSARGPVEPSVERSLQHCGTVRGTV